MSSSQLVDVAQVLDAVAEEMNVDFIGGFTALVEKGIARGDRALIEAIPHALANTERVCASVFPARQPPWPLLMTPSKRAVHLPVPG